MFVPGYKDNQRKICIAASSQFSEMTMLVYAFSELF